MSKPNPNEYSSFYEPYLEILPDDGSGLNDLLELSLTEFNELFSELPSEKEEYRYDTGKWSIKELVQHIIDAERVFVYRALRFSREDLTELSGFDENLYVETSNADQRSMSSLIEEFNLMRKSNILMYKAMDESTLVMDGMVSGNRISVRALGYICCGHLLHHLKIIKERYLD